MPAVDVTVEFEFAAAHRLPRHPGACRRPHGHNYRLFVTVTGNPDRESGMVADFDDIGAAVREHVLASFDHQDLNQFLENPTAENLAVDIWNRLSGKLAGLSEVVLYETSHCHVTYRGPENG